MMNALRNAMYRGDIVTALRINHGMTRRDAAQIANLFSKMHVETLRAHGVPAVLAADDMMEATSPGGDGFHSIDKATQLLAERS